MMTSWIEIETLLFSAKRKTEVIKFGFFHWMGQKNEK